MKDHTAAIRDLLDKAECLELSPTLLAILEEAVRLADLHQDVVLGIEARTSLMYVARNLLRGDILAAAFVWCLGQYDRRPDLFAGRNLLTEQRWVIGQLAFKEARELEGMEAQIQAVDAEIARIEGLFASPDFHRTHATQTHQLNADLATAKENLARLYARWEDLEAIQGAAEK